MIKNKRYLVGIDPGANNNTGIALYDSKAKELLNVRSSTIEGCQKLLSKYKDQYGKDLAIILEDPRLDNAIFGAAEEIRAFVLYELYNKKPNKFANIEGIMSCVKKWLKQATGVGMNMMAAKYIEREVITLELPLLLIAPSWRERSDIKKKVGNTIIEGYDAWIMPTKLKKDKFKEITGYCKSSNEHGRDGAMLVYGRTYTNLVAFVAIKQKKTGNGAKKSKGKGSWGEFIENNQNRIE